MQAAGVGGDQQVGPGGEHVGGLAVAQLGRRLGLDQVVDAGRAAADLGLGDLAQLQAGDGRAAPRGAGPGCPGRGPGGRRRGRPPCIGSGCRGATGPSSTSSSDRSRTRSEKALARSAYAGSSRSRWPYSFMAEPQPAALTTTWSTPAASKVSMAALANAWASASRPACRLRAPQQPWPARGDDLAAVGGQHPGGGRVDLGEEHPLDAAGEHPDPPPARPGRRGDLGDRLEAAEGRARARSMADSRSGSRSSSPARRARAPRPERW